VLLQLLLQRRAQSSGIACWRSMLSHGPSSMLHAPLPELLQQPSSS
jgi:hypothetical protein